MQNGRRLGRVAALAGGLIAGTFLAAGTGRAAPEPPRLVLVIVIDQFPAAILPKLERHFSSGGFRLFMERGAWFTEAHYAQAATLTGVGHATIATGALPAGHGIAGNDWFDRAADRLVYCVEDREHRWVGGKNKETDGTSPRLLQAPAIGDTWLLGREPAARVVSISLKDRGSILLAGRLGKAFWYDDKTGLFVSSTYYYPDGKLPAWVEASNAAKPADHFFGATWNLLLPAAAYEAAADDRPYEIAPKGLGKTFPHALGVGLAGPGPELYKALLATPQGNALILDLARAAIAGEGLGQRGTTDFLLLSLTANDYCGHYFGPESLEYHDLTVQTDRQLSSFLEYVDRAVGLDHTVLVLSSDHGAMPSPEYTSARGIAAGRIDPEAIARAADEALDQAFGAGDWAAKFLNPGLFLRSAPRLQHGLDPEAVERVAADAVRRIPGVQAAFTLSEVGEGRLPDTAVARSVARTFHRERSPDVFIIQEPFWYLYKNKDEFDGMHGSPHAFDAHVPVIFLGAGIAPGRHARRVTPADIAPTLAHLLGIEPPAAAEGEVLVEALPVPAGPAYELYSFRSLPPLLDGAGRQALIPVTSDHQGGAPLERPRQVPVFEGGFSGASPVRDLHSPGTNEPFELWTVTDRGPNLVIAKRLDARGEPLGPEAKLFPCPEYQQSLVRVRLLPDRTVRIIERLPLRRRGQPLNGLPSSAPGRPSNETAYRTLNADAATSRLDPSPLGYDLEGIQEDLPPASAPPGREGPDSSASSPGDSGARRFWTCDEYGPSLQLFDGQGNLLAEYVPGAAPAGEGTARDPSVRPLPAVLKHRAFNRGFEGLAVTARQVFAILQSPFDPAGGVSGEAGSGNPDSRLHRIVQLDKRTHAVKLFAYEHLPDPESSGVKHAEVKVGDLAALDEDGTRFLVYEYSARALARVYRISIPPEGAALDPAAGPAYEAGKAACTSVAKELVLDLTRELRTLPLPAKGEGLAVLNDHTLAITFDNDYGFESDDAEVFELRDAERRAFILTVAFDTALR